MFMFSPVYSPCQLPSVSRISMKASHDTRRMNVKFVLAKYDNNNDDNQRIIDYLKTAHDKNAFVDEERNIFFMEDRQNKWINLNSGMKTLATKMQVKSNLDRIVMRNLPNSFFEGYSEQQLENCKFFGMLTKERIRQMCKTLVGCEKNRGIVDCLEKEGAVAIMKKGVVHPSQLSAMMHAEQVIKTISEEEEDRKKDLKHDTKIRHTFANGIELEILVSGCSEDYDHGDDASAVKVIDPDGKTAYCIKMTRSELDDTKRKHYYVYSTSSNVGKSTFMKKMLKLFNCTAITDFSNWVGMKAHAQFILADEVSSERRMTIADLKTLTGGDASHFAGRRKSHGASFVPRPDAQVIFFSNHHLFDVHGRWSSKHGRRLIYPSVAGNLRARFNIIKLDESEGSSERDDAEYHTRDEYAAERPPAKRMKVC